MTVPEPNGYIPTLYFTNGVHTIEMETTSKDPSILAPPVRAPANGALVNHDDQLAANVDNLSVADSKPLAPTADLTNGHIADTNGYPVEEELPDSIEDNIMTLGLALAPDRNSVREAHLLDDYTAEVTAPHARPMIHDEPSRSYLGKTIPVVTTYDHDFPETTSTTRHIAGSTKRSSVKRSASKDESVKPPSSEANAARTPSRAATVTGARSSRPASSTGTARPASAAGSRSRLSSDVEGVGAGVLGGVAVGEVISAERQRELQQQPGNRVSLHDHGVEPHESGDRPTRSTSPRPTSPFGHRPQPNLMTVTEDGRESRYGGGRDSRNGMLDRSGTVVSRANTHGRNGTLSRAVNGGTVGTRRGAFGRGAGTSIGTQPEEVLGRDDIHTRAELSERVLDDTTLRRLSTMEKKDAKRLSKVIKAEGRAEADIVKGSIRELEGLVKLQKEAAYNERKSQRRLSKWTTKEHKARLSFLKEKEKYERIEADLRNAENDYEERRDHAAGLTSQVAEKTQELDDLRGQKAADDRERAVKLLALRNPAHS